MMGNAIMKVHNIQIRYKVLDLLGCHGNQRIQAKGSKFQFYVVLYSTAKVSLWMCLGLMNK